MNVGIGTEAALFPEKEYIMEISFAVYLLPRLIFTEYLSYKWSLEI
jgi:hypothetical protein